MSAVPTERIEPPIDSPPLRIEAHPDVIVRIVGFVSEAEMAARLGDATAYTQRLRRELSEISDELAAVRYERDGLRQRVRQLEHSVSVVSDDSDRERTIESEVRRRLDRIMRERPRPGRE